MPRRSRKKNNYRLLFESAVPGLNGDVIITIDPKKSYYVGEDENENSDSPYCTVRRLTDALNALLRFRRSILKDDDFEEGHVVPTCQSIIFTGFLVEWELLQQILLADVKTLKSRIKQGVDKKDLFKPEISSEQKGTKRKRAQTCSEKESGVKQSEPIPLLPIYANNSSGLLFSNHLNPRPTLPLSQVLKEDFSSVEQTDDKIKLIPSIPYAVEENHSPITLTPLPAAISDESPDGTLNSNPPLSDQNSEDLLDFRNVGEIDSNWIDFFTKLEAEKTTTGMTNDIFGKVNRL